MSNSISAKNFSQYSWSAYLPLIFWWIPILLVFGWGGVIMLMLGEFKLALYEIGIVIFPIPLMFIAYLADRVSKTSFVRGLIIYSFWFIVAFITLFVFISTLGGASMAVVDNPHRNWREIFVADAIDAIKGVFYIQPIILVLTAIGVYRIKKISPNLT